MTCDAGQASQSDRQAPSEDVLPARVLVADDEHLVAISLARHLQDLGIEVIGPACGGAEAIELARTDRPAIALIDIRMPNTDGLQVAYTLYHELGIPVVIVSAYSNAEYVRKGADLGVFGYLLKPVTADELRASLAVAWSRYQKHLQLRVEVADLKTALENRKLVERAKGILMDRLGLKEADAMRRLQKHARDNRRLLHEVARSIIESEELFKSESGPTHLM